MATILVLFFSLIAKRAAVAYDFIVGNETMTWDEAETWCLQNHGRHLASIHNETQKDDASAVCGDTNCWIGANCQDSSWGDWRWSDGTIWSYTKWLSGEPNDSDLWTNEECVHMYTDGQWNDVYCGYNTFLPLCGSPGTDAPTSAPTPTRTSSPTAYPTATPSSTPTVVPTAVPTEDPSTGPTVTPSTDPSAHPATEPTEYPTTGPTFKLTNVPSDNSTDSPSAEPSTRPTPPTSDPTSEPTSEPTLEPTKMCDPIESCTECLQMNADDQTRCLWHSAQNRCYFRADLEYFDQYVIVDEGICPDYNQTLWQSDTIITMWQVNEGIIAGFSCFNAIAWIDAKWLRQNDYFHKEAIFKAMFGVLDLLSDVLFSWVVTQKQAVDDRVPFVIPIISWVTIAVPIFLSLVQLTRQSRGPWLKEDIARQWMARYSFILYILPFICGSSFVAIAIRNSNALQLNVFSMGLSRAKLSKFSLQRVWTVMLLENIPQLSMHIWFMIVFGFHEVAFASAVYSTISLIVTLLAIYTQRQIYLNRQCVLVNGPDREGSKTADKDQRDYDGYC